MQGALQLNCAGVPRACAPACAGQGESEGRGGVYLGCVWAFVGANHPVSVAKRSSTVHLNFSDSCLVRNDAPVRAALGSPWGQPVCEGGNVFFPPPPSLHSALLLFTPRAVAVK